MTLSQVQIIQSLGEALAWFEKELGWGVAPAELRHLTGRIGELYAAMITNGQMALATNQNGYDVVSAAGERLSVKTIATSTHVTFNEATFDRVDRVLVLRIHVDGTEATIEEILDCSAVAARTKTKATPSGLVFHVPSRPTIRAAEDLSIIAAASLGDYSIEQVESGSILLRDKGEQVMPALPELRKTAKQIGVDVVNGNGNPHNTRQLGAKLIERLSVT